MHDTTPAAGLPKVHDMQTVQRLREILGDRSDAIVSVCTPDGQLLWASDSGIREMFGRDAAQLPRHDATVHVHPDDMANIELKVAHALRGNTVTYEHRAQAADGGWQMVRTVLWSTTAGGRTVLVSVTTAAGDDTEAGSLTA